MLHPHRAFCALTPLCGAGSASQILVTAGRQNNQQADPKIFRRKLTRGRGSRGTARRKRTLTKWGALSRTYRRHVAIPPRQRPSLFLGRLRDPVPSFAAFRPSGDSPDRLHPHPHPPRSRVGHSEDDAVVLVRVQRVNQAGPSHLRKPKRGSRGLSAWGGQAQVQADAVT